MRSVANPARRANRFGLTESCQAPKAKIFLFTGITICVIHPPSPRRHEGRSRDRHRAWRGLRWTLAASGASAPGETRRRTAKSCGPGAATLASIPAGLCWRGNGGKKGRSPGRVRISRKAIARGRPGCLGCTCQTRVRSLLSVAHGDAGAAGTRLSLRPLFERGPTKCKPQAKIAP